MSFTLAVIGGFLVTVTLLPLLRVQHYVVRSWDFPRLQIATLLLATLIVGLSLGLGQDPVNRFILIVLGLCLLLQAWWIWPYLPLVRREVVPPRQHDPDRSIRILTANLLQSNRRAAEFLALVRQAQPDVVIALEADAWWQAQLDTLHAAGFTEALKRPQDNLYGMLLYSRLPLTGTSIEYLVEPGVPSMHAVATLRCGETLRLHALHPAPPSPSENETSAPRDAELVLVGRHVARARRPAIVMGDLNDVAWSATTRLFRKLSGMLDPRVGRGLYCSYHAKIPFMRWPLDHLFHTPEFNLNRIRRLPRFGSDHFPLLIDLQLAADAGRNGNQSGPQADPEEQAWAAELLEGETAPDDMS